jgi:hypothetical protein
MTVLDSSPARPDHRGRAVCVGLVAAPELPAQIAVDLAEELPDLLGRHHDGSWRVAIAEEPLLAGRAGVEEILDAGCQARSAEGWDAAICLTDVPLRDGARPLVAAVDRHDKVAIVNIPAFGATLLKPRVRQAALALIGDIAAETLEGPNQLKARRPAEVLAPIHRETAPDVRYVMPAGPGHLRLLSGMVRANRPWRAFSGLSSAVVAAFGTGAYALLSTSIWQLSGQLGWPRLGAIMLLAVTAMVAWLIIGHDLWEKAEHGKRRKDAALYNGATALTLGVAVLCGYAALFVLLLGVGALLIEGGVFKDNANQAAGLGAYAALAWLGAAIGTVAGALGSKLENIDEVRRATYGHNQCRRRRGDPEADRRAQT